MALATEIHCIGAIRIRLFGQIHDLQALRQLPSAPGEGAETAAVPELVRLLARGWVRWGRGSDGQEFARRLIGDHAVIVQDGETGDTCLIRNAVGTRSLFYRLDGTVLTAGFSVAELRASQAGPCTPDMDWAVRYLFGVSSSADRTAFREIHRVPPGCLLIARSGQAPAIRRYHEWRDDEPVARRRDDRWVEAYRAALDEAVRCRIPAEGLFGCENSGGVDSASIACLLGRALDDPGARMHGFSFMLQPQEPRHIWLTARAAGIVQNTVFTQPATGPASDAELQSLIDPMGYPPEYPAGAPFFRISRAARHLGIRTMFSGFGGDEVGTNPGVLERFALLDRGDHRNLLSVMPGAWPVAALRWLKLTTVGRRSPDSHPGLAANAQLNWDMRFVREPVLETLDVRSAMIEQARYEAPYRRTNDFILKFHLARDHNISNRTETFSVAGGAQGLEYHWPLLDQRVIQQYLSSPGIEKLGPGFEGRYLHRRAVDDVVPRAVNWKPGKDMGGGAAPMTPAQAAAQKEILGRHVASLHPALQDVIDGRRLTEMLAQLDNAQTPMRQFDRKFQSLRMLNLWLHDGHLPA